MIQIILCVTATALVVLATTQFAAAGISASRISTRTRQRRQQALRSLRNAAEIARLDSQLQAAGNSGAGLEWRIMEVADVVAESADCSSFYLVDPYRQKLPEFRPGQYLMVRPALAEASQTTRCYSLSSLPGQAYWRITVRRLPQSKPTATGEGGLSAWLHAHIQAGDCLLIGGPNGHFCLAEQAAGPLVLLAAGVGITPLASMLQWSLQQQPERPVALLYQAQDPEHWPLGAGLHQIAASQPNCHMQTYFSRRGLGPEPSQTDALVGQWRLGKFTANEALDALPHNGCQYYLCGPQSWMEQIRQELLAAGITHDCIHWESFGGIAGAQPEPIATEAARLPASYQVRFEQSGIEAEWHDPEQSLWELARENDIDLPSGCLSGVCGSCRVRVLDGKLAYDRKIAVELAADECLSLAARPTSDLRIDA